MKNETTYMSFKIPHIELLTQTYTLRNPLKTKDSTPPPVKQSGQKVALAGGRTGPLLEQEAPAGADTSAPTHHVQPMPVLICININTIFLKLSHV